MAVAIAFGSQGSAASVGTVATIAGLAFNTAVSDRLIAACISFEINATVTPIASVTIGGVAASNGRTAVDTSGTDSTSAIWVAAVPTGTTGSVVVTLTSGSGTVSVATYSITGADATPADSDSATGSAATISIASLTIPTDGAGIANFTNDDETTAVSWTGASEDLDISVSTVRQSSATVTAVGTNTITADGGTSTQSLVGVAWGPASGGAATSLPVFSRATRFMRRRAA